MKTRLIAASVLMIFSIAAAVFCVFHSNRCTAQLRTALQNALWSAAAESPDLQDDTDEIMRLWEKNKDFFHVLLPHANLNELEWTIGALQTYLEQREKTLYIEQCVRGIQCVNTVREMERPSWGNIF